MQTGYLTAQQIWQANGAAEQRAWSLLTDTLTSTPDWQLLLAAVQPLHEQPVHARPLTALPAKASSRQDDE